MYLEQKRGANGRGSSEVLVLNVAYEVIGLTSIRRAIVLVINGKAESVVDRDRKIGSIAVPSIVRLKYYIKPLYRSTYPTRRNILIRDRYTCQYCGSDKDLTVDHVIPKVRGGKDTWENMVCACKKCNNKKGNLTPEEAGMNLLSKPRKPSYVELLILSKRNVPKEWMDYLFF